MTLPLDTIETTRLFHVLAKLYFASCSIQPFDLDTEYRKQILIDTVSALLQQQRYDIDDLDLLARVSNSYRDLVNRVNAESSA